MFDLAMLAGSRDFLAAWLVDYLAAATLLLFVAIAVGLVIRQPVQRIAIAWAALVGLAVLAILCAMPNRPRVALLPPQASSQMFAIPEQQDISTQSQATAATGTPAALATAPAFDARPMPSRLPSDAVPSNTVAPEQFKQAATVVDRRSSQNDESTPAPTGPAAAAQTPAVVTSRDYHAWLVGNAWLVGPFIAGSALSILWLAVGAFRTRQILRAAEAVPQFAVDELKSIVGHNARVPALLLSRRIDVPAAWGLRRPAILLPVAAVAEPARSSLRMLLAHEWAHIRRGDLWLLALSRGLLIVLFAHPLFWLLRRRIRIDQELIADALAAEQCGRHEYAEKLVAWAREQPPPKLSGRGLSGALGIWERPSQLTRRIAMLLNERMRLRTEATRGCRITTALATTVLAIAASLVTFRALPEATAAPEVTAAQGATAVPVTDATTPVDKRSNDINETAKNDSDKNNTVKRPTKNDAKALPDKITISGVCLDENKKPLADVTVRLFRVHQMQAKTRSIGMVPTAFLTDEQIAGGQNELGQVQSDAQGRFRFEDVNTEKPNAKIYQHFVIVGQKKDRAAGVQPFYPYSGYANQRESLTLQLPAAGALRGRVVNLAGEPVKGAMVTCETQLAKPVVGIRTAVTDADGRYQIDDLRPFEPSKQQTPPDAGGGFYATFGGYAPSTGFVRHPDYARQPFQYSKVPGTIDITLQPPAIVKGKLSGKDGLPVADSEIVFLAGMNIEAVVPVDEQGRYSIFTLPPGKYHVHAYAKDLPTVAQDIVLKSGQNVFDVELSKGGTIRGRVIDTATGKPPVLSEEERMSISTSIDDRTHYAGMPHAIIQRDGTFSLQIPSGRAHYLGMYYGPKWRGVNTDKLFRKGFAVADGEQLTIDIKVKQRTPEDDQPPQPLSPVEAVNVAEQAAVAAIKQLGGWVKTDKIDGQVRVVEVNMVYHEDEAEGRQDNRLLSSEALSYAPKFVHLRSLLLHRTQATDEGLSHLRSLKHLESIYIWDGSEVTDAGVAHLAELPKLRELHLSNAKLTDESLRHLSRLPKLEDISMQGNQFTDRGLEHLRNMTQLKSLWIGIGKGTDKVTDAGLAHLTKLTNLNSLDLQGTKITDAGLVHLRGMSKLKQLLLAEGVTKAGAGALHTFLPKAQITNFAGADDKGFAPEEKEPIDPPAAAAPAADDASKNVSSPEK